MKAIDVILGLIGLPIGMFGFLCITAFATVLWLPYLIWLIIKLIFFRNADDTFLEFIFLCYGLALLWLTIPFAIFET